jgi:3'-phosphoadenosine 5'-phosphosulfate sulfotransferase (PAPS reductase)/FAD synthetase
MSKSDLIISNPENRTIEQLKRLQSLPLVQQEKLTERRIEQFITEMGGKVCVSFSGGKDSTVLLNIVRKIKRDVPAVFVDTGLEYPEIREFVKTIENVIWLKPGMSFPKVIKKYGFPVISKDVSMNISRYKNTKSELQKELRAVGGINPTSGKVQKRSIPLEWQWLINAPFDVSDKCCIVMKEQPMTKFQKENGLYPFVGTMAGESKRRSDMWLARGCNMFDLKTPQSRPLSFWTDKSVWEYIRKNNIPYSKIYDMGESRTGCMFCLYGCQYDRSRFDRMKINHPKQYKACENMGVIDVLHHLDKKLGRDQIEMFDENGEPFHN